MTNEIRKFDVLVIGGGPAGMMAAGRAAELGAKTALIEKNEKLGKKLLITGKGRCNITQAEFDDRKFIESLGKKGKFLFSALSVFGPEEAVEFFEKRGLETKIERGKRIFPATGKSPTERFRGKPEKRFQKLSSGTLAAKTDFDVKFLAGCFDKRGMICYNSHIAPKCGLNPS